MKTESKFKQPPATDDRVKEQGSHAEWTTRTDSEKRHYVITTQGEFEVHCDLCAHIAKQAHNAALAVERTNAEAWRLTCKGKEGAYVQMEKDLGESRKAGQLVSRQLADATLEIATLKSELADEREKHKELEELRELTLERYLTNEQKRIHQQLLQAQAAIAEIRELHGNDSVSMMIEVKRICRTVDLSALDKHDAEVRKEAT